MTYFYRNDFLINFAFQFLGSDVSLKSLHCTILNCCYFLFLCFIYSFNHVFFLLPLCNKFVTSNLILTLLCILNKVFDVKHYVTFVLISTIQINFSTIIITL